MRGRRKRKSGQNRGKAGPKRDDEKQEGRGIVGLVDEEIMAGAFHGDHHWQRYAEDCCNHRQAIVKPRIRPAAYDKYAGNHEGREDQKPNDNQPRAHIRHHVAVGKIDKVVYQHADQTPGCDEPSSLGRVLPEEQGLYLRREA